MFLRDCLNIPLHFQHPHFSSTIWWSKYQHRTFELPTGVWIREVCVKLNLYIPGQSTKPPKLCQIAGYGCPVSSVVCFSAFVCAFYTSAYNSICIALLLLMKSWNEVSKIIKCKMKLLHDVHQGVWLSPSRCVTNMLHKYFEELCETVEGIVPICLLLMHVNSSFTGWTSL